MKVEKDKNVQLFLTRDELRTLFAARDILSEAKLLVGDGIVSDKWDRDTIGLIEQGVILFARDVRLSL